MLDKEIQESEERAQKLEVESTLKAFWSESENIVMKAPSGHKLKDIARYEVTVKESVVPEGDLMELETEKKVAYFQCFSYMFNMNIKDLLPRVVISS